MLIYTPNSNKSVPTVLQFDLDTDKHKGFELISASNNKLILL